MGTLPRAPASQLAAPPAFAPPVTCPRSPPGPCPAKGELLVSPAAGPRPPSELDEPPSVPLVSPGSPPAELGCPASPAPGVSSAEPEHAQGKAIATPIGKTFVPAQRVHLGDSISIASHMFQRCFSMSSLESDAGR